MIRLISSIASVSVLALLAACGGGDGSDDLSRYIGTWAACSPGPSAGSASTKETLVLGPQTNNTLAYTSSNSVYLGLNCTGTSTILPPITGVVTFNGTKTIGTEVVDRVTVTHDGATNKDVLLVRSVSALTLLTGLDPDQGGALDAEGYPVALDNNMVFARQ